MFQTCELHKVQAKSDLSQISLDKSANDLYRPIRWNFAYKATNETELNVKTQTHDPAIIRLNHCYCSIECTSRAFQHTITAALHLFT